MLEHRTLPMTHIWQESGGHLAAADWISQALLKDGTPLAGMLFEWTEGRKAVTGSKESQRPDAQGIINRTSIRSIPYRGTKR